LVLLIARGANLGRWLFVPLLVGATVMLVVALQSVGTRQETDLILIVRHCLIVIAGFLLFSHSANDWFRLSRIAKPGGMNPLVPPPLPGR
jgi:hypothetical protein